MMQAEANAGTKLLLILHLPGDIHLRPVYTQSTIQFQ